MTPAVAILFWALLLTPAAADDLIPQLPLPTPTLPTASSTPLPTATTPPVATGVLPLGSTPLTEPATAPAGPGPSRPQGGAGGGAPTGISGDRTAGTLTGVGVKLRLPPRGGGRLPDEDPLSLRTFGRRAGRFGGPMAAPIGLALLGIAGLAVMAKGSGRFEAVEDERKSLDGRAVIRL